MSNVDKRVVQMEFDNKQFEKDMQATVKSLRNFENNLNSIGGSSKAFDGISKGLADVKSNVKGFNLSPISDAFDKVKVTISGWEMAAMAAITNVVNGAMNAAKNMARSLITDPISQGMQEYELKMNSVQTMLLGAQAIDPSVNLDKVNKKLDELNTYADRTIYSFSDMTQNIGKFINAGVGLDDAVAAIQGVSNVAAISGANANEASRAMYNFAQALSSGYVKLIDWKSIENANMATVEFKNQLIDTAVEMGTLVKEGNYYISTTTDMSGKVSEAFNATKAFNDSLAHQWMTTDVLTATLKRYTDETTELGKKAFKAATEVKTFSQLMDTLKEAVGSGWAQTWEAVFGDFDEAKSMWTAINDVVGGFIDRQSKARVELLQTWKAMGGRNTLIESLSSMFNNASKVLGTVKDAFGEVFSPINANKLINITNGFAKLVDKMQVTTDELNEIKGTFKSIFSVFRNAISPVFKAWKEAFPVGTIGGYIKRIISFMGTMIRTVTDSFNSLTNNGEVIHKIATVLFTLLRTGLDILTGLFTVVKAGIKFFSPIINFITRLVGYVTDLSLSFVHLFKGSKNVTSAFSKFSDAIDKLVSPIQNKLNKALENIFPYLDKFKKWVEDSAKWLADKFASAVDSVSDILLSLVGNLNKSSSSLNKVSSSAKNASEKLGTYRSKISDTIKTIIESIRKNNIFISITEGFSKAFSIIWDYLKKFAQGVNKTLTPVIDKFKKSGAIGTFKEIIKDVATGIGDSVKTIIKAAGPAKDALLKLFGAGNLLDLIQKFVSIYAQLKLGKLAGGIGSFLDKLSEKEGILDQLSKSFKSFVDNIKKPLDQIGKRQKSFRTFATSVLMIATSLYLVSKIPTEKLGPTIAALSGIVAGFAVITIALEKLSAKNEKAAKNFASMALLIASFAKVMQTIMFSMAVLMLVIDRVDPATVKNATKVVAVIAGLITAFGVLFTKFAKAKITASQILSFALLMKVVSSAIKSIALVIAILSLPIFDTSKMWAATICIGILAAEFMGGLILLFSRGSQYGMKASQLLAMSMLMKVVGNAIKSIALVIAILSLPIFDTGKIITATICVSAIGALLGGLVYMTKYINTDFKMLLAMAVYVKAISSAIKSIALVVAILSLPIFSIASLMKSLVVIGLISTLIGSLVLLTTAVNGSNAKKSAQAMLILAASIAIVSLSVIKLSKIDLGQALVILGALTVAFGLLGGALIGMSKFAKGIEKLGKAFMWFGVGAAAFGAGIYLVVRAVKIMNKLGPQGIQTMTDMITALMSNLPKWIGMLITGTLDALSKSIPAIAKSVVDILVAIINTVTQSASTIVSAIVNMFKAIATALSSAGSGFNIADLFWAIQAVALIAGLIFVLQYISSDMKAALKGIALMALVLAALVGSLILINQFTNPDKTIEILKGMAVAMAGLAAIFGTVALIGALINKISGGNPAAGAKALLFGILGFAAFLLVSVLVVGIIGAVINIWSEDEVVGTFEKAIKVMRLTGQAIGTFMGSIVSSFANIVSNSDASIAMLLAIVPVILALEPLMLVLPILTLFIGVIGALGTLLEDTFNWDLVAVFETAAKIMGGIGNALGQFIGGFVRGVMEQLSQGFMDSLITFADGLAEFMVHLQPFIDAVKQLDMDTLGSVGILTLIILEMAAAELIAAITGFLSFLFGGSKSIVSFAAEMAAMAPYLVEFSNTLKEGHFNGALVTMAANAALMLTKVANNLPKSGGLFQLFTGTSMSMDEFGKQLKGFGEAIVQFGKQVEQLNQNKVRSMDVAAEAVSKLSDVAKNMPKSGGLWQMFTGTNTTMDKFGEQLKGLGTALVEFAASVQGITAAQMNSVNNAVPIVNDLVEIANNMPKSGGFVQAFTGNGLDFDKFGEQLPKLGNGLSEFASSVKTLDSGTVVNAQSAVDIIGKIAAIAGQLNDQKSGGWAGFFGGDSKLDLDTFADKIPKLGEGVAGFAKATSGIDEISNIESVTSAITQLATAFSEVADTGDFDISKFSTNVDELASASTNMNAIADMFGSDNFGTQNTYKRIEAVGKAVGALADAFDHSADSERVKSVVEACQELLKVDDSGRMWTEVADLFGSKDTDEIVTRTANLKQIFDNLGSGLYKLTPREEWDLTDFISSVQTIYNNKSTIAAMAGIFGDDNGKVQEAAKRVQALINIMTGIQGVFDAIEDGSADEDKVTSFISVIDSIVKKKQNFLDLADMFGEKNSETQATFKRIEAIGKVFTEINNMLGIAGSGDSKTEISDTLFTNIAKLYEDKDKLTEISNMFGKDTSTIDSAKERLVHVGEGLKALHGVFEACKNEANLSETFFSNINQLYAFAGGNGTWWSPKSAKEYKIMAIANMLGENNSDAEAAKKRLVAVGEGLQALADVFNSCTNQVSISDVFLNNIELLGKQYKNIMSPSDYILRIADMFGKDNGDAEAAKKRLEAVSEALTALSGVFNSATTQGDIKSTFLKNIESIGDSKYINYIRKISKIFGKTVGEATVGANRMDQVTDALVFLNGVFNSLTSTANVGTKITSNISALGGQANNIKIISEMFGTSKEDATKAKERLQVIKEAMTAINDIFTNSTGSLNAKFVEGIDSLIGMIEIDKLYDKATGRSKLTAIAELLGKEKSTSDQNKLKIYNVANSLVALGNGFKAMTESNSTNVESFSEALTTLSELSLETIAKEFDVDKTNKVLDKVKQFIFDLGKTFEDKKAPLNKNVTNMISQVYEATKIKMTSDKPKIINQFTAVLDASVSKIMEYGKPQKGGKFYDAGVYVCDGLIKGITDALNHVELAGKSIASKAIEGTKKGFDSHSPSRIYRDIIAQNAVMGLILGFRDRTNMVFNAGSDLAQNAVNGTKGVIGRISDAINSDMNLQPVITPILDLSEMSYQSGRIGGILNAGSTISMANRTSSLIEQGRNIRLDARLLQNESPDVVAAVDKLTERMDSLESAIINRPIMLDKTKVSKEITPEIDKNLGRRAYYSRRGN